MTIVYSPARAATLATADQSDNPFVTPAPLVGTYATAIGTPVSPASNAATGTTYDPWIVTPGGAGNAAWEVTFDTPQTPTLVALAAHNIAESGASVRVQYDVAGVWTETGAGSVTPTDNQAICWRQEGLTSTKWRLTLSSANPAVNVSIGVIYVGSEIIFPRRIYQGYRPPLTPTQVELLSNVSEGGQLLGTTFKERGSVFEADMSLLPESFVRSATWLDFQRRWNRGFGSFWAWRPTKYDDFFYAWRTQGSLIAPNNTGPRSMMGLQMTGRLYHE